MIHEVDNYLAILMIYSFFFIESVMIEIDTLSYIAKIIILNNSYEVYDINCLPFYNKKG